ncbi:hypothetical protein SH139x_003049 [Planctomycetaceae bacterium SH139]
MPDSPARVSVTTRPARQPYSPFVRWLLLAIGVGGILGGLLLPAYEVANRETLSTAEGGLHMLGNSLLRIGIVMLALWLALPTLKQPLLWLPPGVAGLCLVMIGVLAAQPRLIVLILPALVVLISMRWVFRLLRR